MPKGTLNNIACILGCIDQVWIGLWNKMKMFSASLSRMWKGLPFVCCGLYAAGCRNQAISQELREPEANSGECQRNPPAGPGEPGAFREESEGLEAPRWAGRNCSVPWRPVHAPGLVFETHAVGLLEWALNKKECPHRPPGMGDQALDPKVAPHPGNA